MPEKLMLKVKRVVAERKTTFRALVIDALEQSLSEEKAPFVLRDASVGYDARGEERVSSETINTAIDENRIGSS